MIDFIYRVKYHFNYLNHIKYHQHKEENFKIKKQERNLRKIIIQNYSKSLVFSNLVASYLNYIRKNKTMGKFILSNIVVYF
jgi:hypothetical protein